MTPLEEFLAAHGLDGLGAAFRENDIDLPTLLELDERHLKELGLSLGHRVKLLKAIAALRDSTRPAPAPSAAEPQPPPPSEPERRQITVLFCDIVGSTELAGRVDPEDMRDIIRAYQDTCAGVIARFDGYLAKFLGDGVLAYFGYPRAHEDSSERAIRSGLEIVDALSRLVLKGADRLNVRIGIATGTVVVGDLVGEGSARELSVVGGAPNLAARLQAAAKPDTVLISESTRSLAKGAFLYEDLGSQSFKGVAEPVHVWRVLGENVQTSRFEATQTDALTGFVGREQELALLLDRWEQAVAGEGQVVLLCGEPGIGKSRIADQLRQKLAGLDHVRIRYQCSPFHLNSALRPVISQLEFAAGLAAEDSDDARLAKLESLLAETSDRLQEVVPLVADLLNIPLGGRYPALDLPADQRKQRTLRALADQLVSLSRRQPVLWLVEDAHWIDPTTKELIGLCIDRIRDARVLALVTHRPEFQSPWGSQAHVTGLALNRLGRRQCLAVVEQVCNGKTLPPEIVDQIVAKTDGIPLFVEELTKAVLESGLLRESHDRYELDGPLPPLAIPATLQDSLLARLDRLAPAKEVAQIGAAIGREFGFGLLEAVAAFSGNQLKDALAELVSSELVFCRGEPPDATYIFKHALVQDAAYATLIRSRRQQLHARIAKAIEERFARVAELEPELLAHHYEAAGLDEPARRYWAQAGRAAIARSAYLEAGAHFARALRLLRKLPSSGERAREEIEILLNQGMAFVATRGPGSPEVGSIYEQAVAIGEGLGDDPLHFQARWGDWLYHSLSGDLPEAGRIADRLVRLAKALAVDDYELQAHHARWTTAFLRGEIGKTREDIERGLALYDRERHRGHLLRYGAHDPGVCACATGACTWWQAGDAHQAKRLSDEAIRLGRDLNHPFSRAISLWYAAFLAQMIGDAAWARSLSDELIELASHNNFPLPLALARIVQGWAQTREGDLAAGAKQMQRVYEGLLEAKQRAYLTYLGTVVAGAKLDLGEHEETLSFLGEVETLSQDTHQQMFMPDLHRLRAEALRRLDPKSERIEASYRAALSLAREQGARALEQRAAASFAEWLSAAGRPLDAGAAQPAA